MARIGDTKHVAGKEYKVFAITNWKANAEKDARILKRRGMASRVILDKDYKSGWRKPLKRYLILGRKLQKNPAKQKKSKASEDTRQRRKYARGGRIEAYTMGEAAGGKGFPW